MNPPRECAGPIGRRAFGSLAWAAALGAAAQPLVEIRHNLALEGETNYYLDALRLLLDLGRIDEPPCRLTARPPASQSRVQIQLMLGELDAWASMSSTERDLPCLHRCLRRGLNGIRLPVVLAERRAELERVRGVDQLRRLRIAQVMHWPDTPVLERQGMKVVRLPNLKTFAAMLELDRADTLLLAADEAVSLAAQHPKLAVLDDWAVFYPSVFSFFTSPKRPELLARLAKGWERARAEGSLLALWQRHLGQEVQASRLAGRRFLRLENPQLPPQTPRQDRRDWHPVVWRLLNA